MLDSTILQILEAKDVMTITMLPAREAKWNKLSADYAVVSASMVSLSRSRFHDFTKRDGDMVVQLKHRFDKVVNECIIEAVVVSEADNVLVLLT